MGPQRLIAIHDLLARFRDLLYGLKVHKMVISFVLLAHKVGSLVFVSISFRRLNLIVQKYSSGIALPIDFVGRVLLVLVLADRL